MFSKCVPRLNKHWRMDIRVRVSIVLGEEIKVKSRTPMLFRAELDIWTNKSGPDRTGPEVLQSKKSLSAGDRTARLTVISCTTRWQPQLPALCQLSRSARAQHRINWKQLSFFHSRGTTGSSCHIFTLVPSVPSYYPAGSLSFACFLAVSKWVKPWRALFVLQS